MTTRRVVLPALLLIGCVASWLVADALSNRSPMRAAALAGEGLDRPLISETRLSMVRSEANVIDVVAPIIGSLPEPPSPQSCSVVMIGGDIAASTRADLPLVPGAAQMLVTGWTALQLLGPDHRFVTTVESEAVPSADGVVAGSLYVVGGGDPVLMTTAWAAENLPGHTVMTDPSALADAVVAAGVSNVFGAVIGVEGRYDQLRSLPGLAAETPSAAVGLLGALRINGAQLSATNTTSVDRANPSATSAANFDDLLEERGVAIAGLSRASTLDNELPELIEIAAIESAPLSQIVDQMLVENDVVIAEMLLKEIGYLQSGEGSTRAGARQVLSSTRKYLDVDLGAPPPSGSGWDAIGTTTCASIAAIAQAIEADLMATSTGESYNSAALGSVPPEALVVRGEIGDAVSVVARASLAPSMTESTGADVVIVSISNVAGGPTEVDRQHARELLAAIDAMRDLYAQAAGSN